MRLAEIVRAGLPELLQQHGHHLTGHQRRALQAIIDCRTGALGSTRMRCDECARDQLAHRSCGHRSCPQCQHHSNRAWLERQQARLLPVHYFMVTFTLPEQLRTLAYANPATVYALMFKAAIGTLDTFAGNHPQLKGKLGACSVLHTHSRRLDYHPHIHFIVPGGAMDTRRKQWRKLKGRYLFNGRQLASVFRARMLDALNKHGLSIPARLPEQWHVHCDEKGKGLPALKYRR